MSGELSGDYMNYTVHIPPTPDNRPTDSSVAIKAEEQYVSNSLFIGGFNSVMRAHLMDKGIDSDVSHPRMAGAKGSACSMPACDGEVMNDERGVDVTPCACRSTSLRPSGASSLIEHFFSFWALAYFYPFAKWLMGRRRKTPTIVFVWSGLIAITLALLWMAISPLEDSAGTEWFQFHERCSHFSLTLVKI